MKNIYNLISVLFIASLLIFAGCEDRNDLTAPSAPSTGDADFTTLVSIGNSLTAGYQQGALYKSSQDYSIGNLIAQQVHTTYEQPLVSDPGMHNSGPTDGRMEVTSLEPFAFTINTSSGTALNSDYEKAYNNLGIPGIILADVLQTTSSPSPYSGANVFFDLVLRNSTASTPTTALEQALSLQPTFVLGWIGNNDILGHATTGGTLPYTPVATFSFLYSQFAGALAQSGAKAALANIPDVSAIPFFTTVGPGLGLALLDTSKIPAGTPLVFEGSHGIPIMTTSAAELLSGQVLVTLKASPFATLLGDVTGAYYAATGIPVPAGYNTAAPFGFSAFNPFPGALVLDKAEISEVKDVINQYNEAIAAQANQFGFALVDIHSFFNSVASTDVVFDGISYSAFYVKNPITGAQSVFSLDGVHPNTPGYGIITNQFIKAINAKYNASIPEINVSTLPGSLIITSGAAKFGKYGIPAIPLHAFDNFIF